MSAASEPREDLARLERREIAHLPKYNAGSSVDAVRSRFNVDRVARLASNENPYGASPRAIAAVADASALSVSYPDRDCLTLKTALARFLHVSAERLVIGNGSEALIQLACLGFLNAGERVLTQHPCFGLHEIFAKLMAARVDKVPFNPDLDFDVAAWQRALASPAKIVMIANPSNPVGCRLDAGQFRVVVESAPEDALLLIDEAYYEFAAGRGFPDSVAELSRQRRPWLVLRTFSKAYGLAGLRIGYGIASSAKLADVLDRVRTPFNVNAFALAAATAALDDQEHVRRTVEATALQREVMRRALEAAGYRVAPSHANFLFFDSREPASALAERLLARGVIVKPWSDPGFQRYIRVTVGSRADNEQFLTALAAVAGACAQRGYFGAVPP